MEDSWNLKQSNKSNRSTRIYTHTHKDGLTAALTSCASMVLVWSLLKWLLIYKEYHVDSSE
jgi:hypothetical protein